LVNFDERAEYVERLIRAVGAVPDPAVVRGLVRVWVLDGFTRMVEQVQRMRP
jgi:hypothetical protein